MPPLLYQPSFLPLLGSFSSVIYLALSFLCKCIHPIITQHESWPSERQAPSFPCCHHMNHIYLRRKSESSFNGEAKRASGSFPTFLTGRLNQTLPDILLQPWCMLGEQTLEGPPSCQSSGFFHLSSHRGSRVVLYRLFGSGNLAQ